MHYNTIVNAVSVRWVGLIFHLAHSLPARSGIQVNLGGGGDAYPDSRRYYDRQPSLGNGESAKVKAAELLHVPYAAPKRLEV